MKKRKVFISYHYKDVKYYNKFLSLFGNLIVNKSVEKGVIKSDNHDQYIKQLIQQNNLKDTSVLVVLLGAKTYSRKHVDWEISGALDYDKGNIYAGLLGIRLPSHPDYEIGDHKYNTNNIPSRLADNLDSGYAEIYDWHGDENRMRTQISEAFTRRSSHAHNRDNSYPQMLINR